MHRALLFASAIAVAAGVTAPGAPAGASRGREVSPPLHATSFSTPAQLFGLGPSGCTNLNPDTGRCLIDFFQQDTLDGDIVGQDTNAGSLSVQLPALIGDAVSLATFRGTVRGCPGFGTATFRFVARLGVTPGRNVAKMVVVQGAGRGGLTTLEGTAHIDATVHQDGTINGSGEFRLDCGEGHQAG